MAKAKPHHIAETRNPLTDKRERRRHARKKDARLHSARSLIDREEREEILGRTTFGEAAQALLERLELDDSTDKDKAFEPYLRLHIEPLEIAPGCRLVDQQLRFLTKDDFVAVNAAIEAKRGGEKLKYATLSFVCQVLRSGFKSLTPPVMFPSDIPGRKTKGSFGTGGIRHRQKRVPFGDQIDRRLEISTGPLRILMVLLIHFGLRISEALEVRRVDLDLQPDSKVSWLKVRGTKTKASSRTVPMNVTARDILRTWMNEIGGGPHQQVISDSPTRFYKLGAMRRRYLKMQDLLGGENFTFHEFRAYFVTAALAGNVSMHHITQWIGHTRMSTTVKHYAGAILLAHRLWQSDTGALPLDDFTEGLRHGWTPADIVGVLAEAY